MRRVFIAILIGLFMSATSEAQLFKVTNQGQHPYKHRGQDLVPDIVVDGMTIGPASSLRIASSSTLYVDEIDPNVSDTIAMSSSISVSGNGLPSEFTTGITNYQNETIAGTISVGNSAVIGSGKTEIETSTWTGKTNIWTGGDNVTNIRNSGPGIITLGSSKTGGNQENLMIDGATTANQIDILSSSGVSQIRFAADLNFMLRDTARFKFGDDSDVSFIWVNTGNDNFQVGVAVGGASDSGYFSIMEYGDTAVANRSPLSTSANPVQRWYSSNEFQAQDYGEVYHSGGDSAKSGLFNIATGSTSNILFTAAYSSTMKLDDRGLTVGKGGSANNTVCWKADGKSLGYCSSIVDVNGDCTCN